MEKLYWIWLQTVLGCGNALADVIVKQQLSPGRLYHSTEEELAALDCLSAGLIKKMKSTPLDQAERILRQCESLKIWVMVPTDPDYPQRLKHIYQVPLVLYGVGDRSLLDRDLLLTMVGSRGATDSAKNAAYELAQDLVQYGFGIVSGMALGIDSRCHEGALDMGGVTIGVAGCGLNISYPSGNVELRRRIGRNGAIISEYPPGVEPKPYHFPVRNRIVSGLSLGTIVVEAPEKSGTLITAELALQQGRDVFVLPTDLYNTKGQGNLQLIGQGATVLTSAQTVAEEYSMLYGDRMSKTIKSRLTLHQSEIKPSTGDKEPPKELAPSPIPQDMDPAMVQILHCLEGKTLRVEEIAAICGMEMQETLILLSELEIDGHVKAYAGKKFGR